MTNSMSAGERFEQDIRTILFNLAPATVPARLDGLGGRVALESPPRRQLSFLALPQLAGALAVLAVVGFVVATAIQPRPLAQSGAPRSSLISAFISQTDGYYGYRMLRPANWAADIGSFPAGRRYDAPGSVFQDHGVSLEVINLAVSPEARVQNLKWDLWAAHPTLDGWATALEQEFAGPEQSTVTVLSSLPDARIFAARYKTSYLYVVACAVDSGRPLVIALIGSGQYADLAYLRSTGLLDDFATMVGSVRAIGQEPGQVIPSLPAGQLVAPSS